MGVRIRQLTILAATCLGLAAPASASASGEHLALYARPFEEPMELLPAGHFLEVYGPGEELVLNGPKNRVACGLGRGIQWGGTLVSNQRKTDAFTITEAGGETHLECQESSERVAITMAGLPFRFKLSVAGKLTVSGKPNFMIGACPYTGANWITHGFPIGSDLEISLADKLKLKAGGPKSCEPKLVLEDLRGYLESSNGVYVVAQVET